MDKRYVNLYREIEQLKIIVEEHDKKLKDKAVEKTDTESKST
jgi:hypothetical protein